MILYSVIPTEVIFQGMDHFNPQYQELELYGITMQVERIDDNQAKIIRLYSTNAQDYLNPLYAPGTIISYSPRILSS